MTIKKSLVFAGMLLGLLAGPANAVQVTGPVTYYFVNDYGNGQMYTFVNVNSQMVCYRIGTDIAGTFATILAAKQIANKPVTVTCNNNMITALTN